MKRRYSISRCFDWQGTVTEKVSAVMRMFGLTREQLDEKNVIHNCEIEVDDGDIVYITGPSGCGKSVLLRELEKSIPHSERINLDDISLCSDRSVIDCIGSESDLLQSLKLLNAAGLNDCLCILNQPAYLSDGQKYRFRLAAALDLGKRFIFADEFCANLDRITAAVISYNIHKFAKQHGVTFILASSHDDLLVDLAPDVLVVKELSGEANIIYRETGRQICDSAALLKN